MKKKIPNLLTVIRIVLSAVIIAVEPFSIVFFSVYGAFIFLDYADGLTARKLKAESYFGDRLDHAASIIFIMFLSFRYFRLLPISKWCMFWAMGVLIVKCASLVIGAVRYKTAAFINTDWNKIAKGIFYVAPLSNAVGGEDFAAAATLAAFTVASVEELFINFTSKEFDKDIRTALKFKKKKNKKK